MVLFYSSLLYDSYKNHSPTAMVRLCFALLLLYKQEYRIQMPRGFMDDLEGEVANEEIHEGVISGAYARVYALFVLDPYL